MGGKTWQMEEEHFFWRVVVPQSPEGLEPSERRLSWKQCADLMSRELGHRRHRSYSKQLLCECIARLLYFVVSDWPGPDEHFYQNCRSQRPSPRARAFVREYLARRGKFSICPPLLRPGDVLG